MRKSLVSVKCKRTHQLKIQFDYNYEVIQSMSTRKMREV